MSYFVVGPDGAEHGPLEVGTLVEWVRAGQLPPDASVRTASGGVSMRAADVPELSAHYGGFDFSQPPAPAKAQGTAMMPTGNPNALWGYYLGWLSLLCVIGLPLGPFALVKSWRGLRAYKDDPTVFGKLHAIVGLVLGSVGLLGNLFLVGLVVVNLVVQR